MYGEVTAKNPSLISAAFTRLLENVLPHRSSIKETRSSLNKKLHGGKQLGCWQRFLRALGFEDEEE